MKTEQRQIVLRSRSRRDETSSKTETKPSESGFGSERRSDVAERTPDARRAKRSEVRDDESKATEKQKWNKSGLKAARVIQFCEQTSVKMPA